MDGRAVAQRIKERLEALGKSAAGASLEAGLGRSAVQNILSGASESPRTSTLRALAGPLECSLEFLLGMEEYDHTGDDPFVPNTKTLRPVVVDKATVLEQGAFSRDYRTVRLDHGSIVGQADLRLAGHRIEYYHLSDGTGRDEGFRTGDILYAASANESQPLALFSECAVIVERRLHEPSLIEMTLRTVSVSKSELALYGRGDILRLDLTTGKRPEVGDEFSLPDRSTVTIRGLVVRLNRPLETHPSIYAIQKDLTD